MLRSNLLTILLTGVAAAQEAPPVCDRVRFYPAQGAENAMTGGRFAGSNVSPTKGFETLATIASTPAAGKWTEIRVDNHKIYRWLRYEAPPGSFGKVAEIEFYAGNLKLTGQGFGSFVRTARKGWPQVFDGKIETGFESDTPDHQYTGLDLLDAATARTPVFDPKPGDFPGPIRVTITSTPGAMIRYTLDGTIPDKKSGLIYSGPIPIGKTANLRAVSFLDGRAPSPVEDATYLFTASSKPGFKTFHIGNSLTQTTSQFPRYMRAAGYLHEYHSFTMSGAKTVKLWNASLAEEKAHWDRVYGDMPHIDHLTLQPRDFDIAEEADYSIRFIRLAREKSPDLQPWLYTEWDEMERDRPTDKGEVPSSQMQKLWPAATWGESMSAMLLYMEELQRTITAQYNEGKRPRIIPSAIAMGWLHNLIETGKFPGVSKGDFYPRLYQDHVHPNAEGAYLVDMTWFSTFYRQSPEGVVPPIHTTWDSEQAGILQRLAWDVIRNYPDCGLYEEGAEPTGAPRFTPGSQVIHGETRITLSSSTPGAWFRYTLDGTTPERTRGYLYCGVITARPGMTIKTIAFRSGMADSRVSSVVFGTTPKALK